CYLVVFFFCIVLTPSLCSSLFPYTTLFRSIFVGGVKKTIKSVEYILSTLGKEIIYCGCLGSGQVVKLANNIASCVNIATISELQIGRAHVCTTVTFRFRMPSSA